MLSAVVMATDGEWPTIERVAGCGCPDAEWATTYGVESIWSARLQSLALRKSLSGTGISHQAEHIVLVDVECDDVISRDWPR